MADNFNDLKDVRDVEDRLVLSGELLQKILEEPGRNNVETREGLVEDQQLWIVSRAAAMRTRCFMPLE